MLRKILIGFIILCGIGLIGMIGYIIAIIAAFGGFEKNYSVSELKDSFEKNKSEIFELKKYFNEIVPKNRFVEIEFDNDHRIGRFGIKPLDRTAGNMSAPMFLEWRLEIDTKRIDSIIKPLGWTRQTLKTLKEKLDMANCIQIESGEPTKIGFQRNAFGMYTFNVFDRPIPENLKSKYNDSCTYIYVNKRLVLEYNGGAIGSQCFYNKK